MNNEGEKEHSLELWWQCEACMCQAWKGWCRDSGKPPSQGTWTPAMPEASPLHPCETLSTMLSVLPRRAGLSLDSCQLVQIHGNFMLWMFFRWEQGWGCPDSFCLWYLTTVRKQGPSSSLSGSDSNLDSKRWKRRVFFFRTVLQCSLPHSPPSNKLFRAPSPHRNSLIDIVYDSLIKTG